MRTHDELTQLADELYTWAMPYAEWRANRGAVSFPHSAHDYALGLVAHNSDADEFGITALVLDADERDILVNMIEAKAQEEL